MHSDLQDPLVSSFSTQYKHETQGHILMSMSPFGAQALSAVKNAKMHRGLFLFIFFI